MLEFGQHDLLGRSRDAALAEAHRELAAQRRVADRQIVLRLAERAVARKVAQRPLHPDSGNQDSGSQPEPGCTRSGSAVRARRDATTASRPPARAARTVCASTKRPRRPGDEKAGAAPRRPPRPRRPAAHRPRRPSISIPPSAPASAAAPKAGARPAPARGFPMRLLRTPSLRRPASARVVNRRTFEHLYHPLICTVRPNCTQLSLAAPIRFRDHRGERSQLHAPPPP